MSTVSGSFIVNSTDVGNRMVSNGGLTLVSVID